MNKQGSNTNKWYDLFYDWDLIDASFTAQYGIRLRNDPDMSWGEFTTLLAGLMSETPLGQVISIRSETDKDILKSFTREQHSIRRKWQQRYVDKIVRMDKGEAERQIKMLQEAMKQAFSK